MAVAPVYFMTKSAFRSAVKRWLLALLAASLALPAFMLIGAIPGVCVHPQGACFGVSLILMFWAVPIAVVVCLLMLLWTIGRRVKGLGLSAGWIVAVVVWSFAAGPAAVFGGMGVFGSVMSWRFSEFAQGLVSSPITIVLFLPIFIAFLWRAEPDDVHPEAANRRMAWTVAVVAAAHATILYAGSALSYPLFAIAALRPLLHALSVVSSVASLGLPYRWAGLFGWIDLAIFTAALTYILRSRGDERNGGNITSVAGSIPRPVAQRASFGRRGS